MSILGRIFGRIRDAHAGSAPAATQAAPAQPAAAQSVPQPQAPTPSAPQPVPAAQAAPAATATIERVDMEKVLDDMAAKNPQKLNWRNSIVDLMKLVGMDSTLQERKELADEMGYTGDKSDTAAMNMWLHKKLMERLKT
jgi:pyruvate/2-oxoglutarate dehydrogenase complex dihydrolipoamide acyltransferase (E2) component